MTSEDIQAIEALASRFPNRDVTLYFPDFEREPAPDSLNQTFGAPVGVDAGSWPIFPGLPELLREFGNGEGDPDDLRMEHLFTIDLRGLTGLGTPAGARALQVYISNTGYNEAWSPSSGHTRVVILGEADVAAGRATLEPPARSQEHTSRRFTLVPVAVPSAVFDAPGDDASLAALREAIWKAPARVGGRPIWLQGDPDEGEYDGDEDSDYDGDDDDDDDDDGDAAPAARTAAKPVGLPGFGGFVMQLDESFVDVNLGDSGVLYVFGDDAYFQCY